MKGAPKERDQRRLKFRRRLYRRVPGDGVNSHTSTGLRRTRGPPLYPILSRNPTPERTSPHSRHGECIGMRSSKSKTSNSYPPHPKRDVAGSRRSSPFHRKTFTRFQFCFNDERWEIRETSFTRVNAQRKLEYTKKCVALFQVSRGILDYYYWKRKIEEKAIYSRVGKSFEIRVVW